MEKLLEVREFEKISCNPDFKIENEYAYLPEPVFKSLEEFIRIFTGDENHADALEFLKICRSDSNAERLPNSDPSENRLRK